MLDIAQDGFQKQLTGAIETRQPQSHIVIVHNGKRYLLFSEQEMRRPMSARLDDGTLIALLPESHLQALTVLYGPAEAIQVEDDEAVEQPQRNVTGTPVAAALPPQVPPATQAAAHRSPTVQG